MLKQIKTNYKRNKKFRKSFGYRKKIDSVVASGNFKSSLYTNPDIKNLNHTGRGLLPGRLL